MMDVNDAFHHIAVHGTKIETANSASCPVVPDALCSGSRITLIAVDENTVHATFSVDRAFEYLLGQPDRCLFLVTERFDIFVQWIQSVKVAKDLLHLYFRLRNSRTEEHEDACSHQILRDFPRCALRAARSLLPMPHPETT